MSVRRLAEEAVQPASFAFTSENASWAEATIRKYPEGREASAVIPLLMRAQEQDGWVTRGAIETVAHMLDMPLIRVLEVATFYTQFQLAPVGSRAHVQVCGTTPCMLRGAGELIELCRKRIHSEPLHTNAAGTLSWEEVECQGACVNAPMIMIFKDTYEDLTPERLDEIIDAFEAGKGDTVAPGPQIDRLTSAPASGLTSLTDEAAVSRANGANGKARAKAGGDKVPPSKAARPKTHAAETDRTIASPSSVKTGSNGENASSTKAPRHDERRADRASEEVEDTRKTRSHSGKKPASDAAPVKAPALNKQKAPGEPKRGTASPSRATSTPPSVDKGRPDSIEKPAQPDDLKLISGVGPKVEGILNGLGIYTYAQIASWKKAERAWVDDQLNFRGRIEREEWVKQAKALARGGAAEYERVFGKKPR